MARAQRPVLAEFLALPLLLFPSLVFHMEKIDSVKGKGLELKDLSLSFGPGSVSSPGKWAGENKNENSHLELQPIFRVPGLT
jgi:hypothetical protein